MFLIYCVDEASHTQTRTLASNLEHIILPGRGGDQFHSTDLMWWSQFYFIIAPFPYGAVKGIESSVAHAPSFLAVVWKESGCGVRAALVAGAGSSYVWLH